MRGVATRTPHCCGLFEIGGFDSNYGEVAFLSNGSLKVDGYTTLSAGYAYMCVTRRTDLKQKRWLKKNKFKPAGKWKNPNTRRTLTLWLKFPG